LTAPFHIGSCAWVFEDWRGAFYPGDLPAQRWLGYYGRFFNTVEIDSTFNTLPTPQNMAHWLAEAPAHFRFTCKAPKAITHELRLRACGEALDEFLGAIQPLHGRMGAMLFQMPPSFVPGRDAAALRDFVRMLPHGWKFAIEFRDPDWHQPRFVKLLEEHGVCWAWSDTTSVSCQDEAPFGFLPVTADFVYLRLIGDARTGYTDEGRRRFSYKRLLWSRAAAIESWAVRLRKLAGQVKHIYVLCGNHYEGFAPITCRELGGQLGMEFALPGPEHDHPAHEHAWHRPRQMTLL
jgi:uncharacterized protein YecE (DUF72 family)